MCYKPKIGMKVISTFDYQPANPYAKKDELPIVGKIYTIKSIERYMNPERGEMTDYLTFSDLPGERRVSKWGFRPAFEYP